MVIFFVKASTTLEENETMKSIACLMIALVLRVLLENQGWAILRRMMAPMAMKTMASETSMRRS